MFQIDTPITLEDALKIIRGIQSGCMECGWYISLAGGVLNLGVSDNDIDLVAVPRTPESKVQEIMPYLIRQLGNMANVSLKTGGIHVKFSQPIEILFVYPRE